MTLADWSRHRGHWRAGEPAWAWPLRAIELMAAFVRPPSMFARGPLSCNVSRTFLSCGFLRVGFLASTIRACGYCCLTSRVRTPTGTTPGSWT